MRLSARNIIKGKVLDVTLGATTAHVKIDVGGTVVTASITNAAVDELKLAPGKAEERWDDCPAVSEDFDVAWNFITGRVETLVARLSAK